MHNAAPLAPKTLTESLPQEDDPVRHHSPPTKWGIMRMHLIVLTLLLG
jgi:hypothetical protein